MSSCGSTALPSASDSPETDIMRCNCRARDRERGEFDRELLTAYVAPTDVCMPRGPCLRGCIAMLVSHWSVVMT